jgi:hypothetical protein
MTASLGVTEGEGHPFLGKGVGEDHFFQLGRKQMVTFEVLLGAFGSQTALKCSKIVQTSCL